MGAVEFMAILFFAALGAIYSWTDCAHYELGRASRQAGVQPLNFEAMDHAPKVFLVAGLSAMALASGGGIIRRGFEIAFFWLAAQIGHPMRTHYEVPKTFLWPTVEVNWRAVFIGWALGFVIGAALTWQLSTRGSVKSEAEALAARKLVDRESAAVDGLGTAFFAAFGMKYGLQFFDGLPSLQLPWLPWRWEPWLVFVSAPVVMLFAAFVSCGGGLARGIVARIFFSAPGGVGIGNWASKKTVRDSAVFGGICTVAFYAVAVFPQQGGKLIIDDFVFSAIALSSSLVGFVVWSIRHR